MCDACERTLDRRALLRRAIVGGTVLAGSGLWTPSRLLAAGNGADDDGSGLEFAAMAEDKPRSGSAVPSGSASGGTTQTPAAGSGSGGTTSNGSSASAGGGGGGVRGVRQVAAPNGNGLAAPPIASRTAWGADEEIRLNDRAYAPVRKLIVHHSASENKPRNPADVVRFIQRYHTTNRGYSDTGYNYLIDHKGAIYEGRAARAYRNGEAISNEDGKGWGVVGAHAKGNNAGTCGVCLIGNFDNGSPTDAAISSLVWLLAYKASRYRIDATGNDEYIDLYGAHRVYPNIAGHRQVGATACPGKRLYSLLPAIRDEVARRAGHWDPLTVDVPSVVRWEIGALRSPGAAATSNASGSGSTSASGGGANTQTASGSGAATSGGAVGSGTDPGSGTKLIGVRVVSSPGRIYTAGKGRQHGNPSSNGSSSVVALANRGSGDGYWALDQSGAVTAFGGAGHFGDAAGKGAAADLAVTTDGQGYWVLMADGGIYPFGAAGYASSPKKAGLGGTARRIVARPQGDGYWVLMSDGTIRAFGTAGKFGTTSGAGNPVDLCVTPSGKGYWVLTDTGVVAPFGDAADKGDLKRSSVRWSKPATHLVRTGSGGGYVIVNSEGSMLAFGDAPLFASFGGSGMQATGAAPVYG